MASEFLDACRSGDLEQIRALKSSGADVQTADAEGQNGLHLAIAANHWHLLKPLIDEIEVSPHKVTTRGENLYHVMIRAVANGEPPADVIAVFREECKQRWGDQERGRKEAEDKKKPDRPNCAPPIIISSSAAE